MLGQVSPRNFGNFKEGATVVAKFIVGGGGGITATFTPKATNAQGQALSNYNGLTMARSGVGIITLTLRNAAAAVGAGVGCRDLAVKELRLIPATPGTAANYQQVVVAGYNESTGTVTLRTLSANGATLSGGATELALANGDEIDVILYVNK